MENRTHPATRTEAEKDAGTKYTLIMSEIESKLEKNETVTGQAKIARDS